MYSIKDVERLSGIKAHTIRIWEKRYGLVEPRRTSTNIRYYTNEELKKILNVTLLNKFGIKISKIANLSADELRQKVLDLAKDRGEEEVQIESLVISMIDLDKMRFERILNNCVLRLGFENTVVKVLYPFFRKVGVLWQVGAINPAQEHFISNLVRQKIIVAIDGQTKALKEDAKKFLLFLPEGELHEIGLLFYSYLIQKAGHDAVYLGQSVPMADAVSVNAGDPADFIITSSLSIASAEDYQRLLTNIRDHFPDPTIVLINQLPNSGDIIVDDNTMVNLSLEDFKALL